jgi:putative membrane protein
VRPGLRSGESLRIAVYIGGVLGLALLVVVVLRSDFTGMLQTADLAGWPLLWLVPYRLVFFTLYALGWLWLLRPYNPLRRPGFGYLLWVTSVREAIDRLLPVASIGGGVVGVRLLRWRGVSPAPAAATVMVEILLTVIAIYLFTALGLILLTAHGQPGETPHRVLLGLVLSLPVPVGCALLLRYGSVFERFEGFLRAFVGVSSFSETAASLDRELRASLHRFGMLTAVGALQLAALISSALEIWFVLRLCGHPIDFRTALILESLTQALRHVAFVVPAGLGVQEASLMVFGSALGISSELALAVSFAKRLREVLCGLPCLVSWQWAEGRRLRNAMGSPS